MTHDYSLVFETDSEYWQRVLAIFAKNEKYPKKVVSNRNLHHKFPRSFSKMLGEQVDNDSDNLISLSLADHFLVHYYYYLLAKKGFRQRMATAFTFMAKKGLKYMTPETAEQMAKDYEEARAIANQHISESLIGHDVSDETRKKQSERAKGRPSGWKGKHPTDETRKKISENHADVSGSNHPLWGKHLSDETKQKISEAQKGKKHSEETKAKMSKARKGRKLSDEHKAKLREAAIIREAKKRINQN